MYLFSCYCFSIFWCFKGLNQRFTRLKEKAQDNISKRAAVVKEPSILEKEQEDQSKYYLSYPKPPVLDMKWENHDINVVERAKIPKFSELDDIVIPLRLLKLFSNFPKLL